MLPVNLVAEIFVAPVKFLPVKLIISAVLGLMTLGFVTFHNAIEALLSLVKVLLLMFPRLKSADLINWE